MTFRWSENYEVPFDEPWDVLAAVSLAAWLDPQEAAEVLRRLASRGYRVVPINDDQRSDP